MTEPTPDSPDPQGTAVLDDYTARAKKYVALAKRRGELKDDLSEVETDMKALHEQLLADFEQAGRQKDRLDGRTIYIRRELRPVWKAKSGEGDQAKTDYAAICAALKAAGVDDFITGPRPNWKQVQSYLNGLDKAGESLPPSFEDIIGTTEHFELRVIK